MALDTQKFGETESSTLIATASAVEKELSDQSESLVNLQTSVNSLDQEMESVRTCLGTIQTNIGDIKTNISNIQTSNSSNSGVSIYNGIIINIETVECNSSTITRMYKIDGTEITLTDIYNETKDNGDTIDWALKNIFKVKHVPIYAIIKQGSKAAYNIENTYGGTNGMNYRFACNQIACGGDIYFLCPIIQATLACQDATQLIIQFGNFRQEDTLAYINVSIGIDSEQTYQYGLFFRGQILGEVCLRVS